MTIKVWNPEDRAEYEQLLRDVCEGASGTGDRVILMERLLVDAENAQREWAHKVDRECRLIGYASEIKSWLKRQRVVVAIGQRKVRKPKVIGTKRKNSAGDQIDYQLPFILLAFDELRTKRKEYLIQVQSYTDNIALMDRLIALADMAPESENPQEAAITLGIDLDAYLKADAA